MPAAGDSAPAVKRRKSKNKFKQQDVASHMESPKAAAEPRELHVVSAGTAKKKNKKKRRDQKQQLSVDEMVAVQMDAPNALPPKSATPTVASRAAAAAQPAPGRFVSLPAAVSTKKGKGKGGGSLLQQMRQRLQGGRFRWLNETLYTTDGQAALRMMRQEPQLMEQYHEGFREQTKGWPVQPVDLAIRWLRGRPRGWAVADLGCGDAKVAAAAQQAVHSFDLTETAPGVVACNMADVPLPDGSVDAAIFCLSLMGTDYGAFLCEAARILKPAGWLWIAEVQSRFVDDAGSSVLPDFLEALGALGFVCKRQDTSNSHFLVLELQREQQAKGGGNAAPKWPHLRACQYKKR